MSNFGTLNNIAVKYFYRNIRNFTLLTVISSYQINYNKLFSFIILLEY